MFSGRVIHKLDDKFRVSIPPRMRDAGDGKIFSVFAATKGIGGCIALLTTDKFNSFLSNFNSEGLTELEELKYYREFLSWKQDVDIDLQGRILLPQLLLQQAKIKKEVLIIGVGEWIEIWDPEEYEKMLKEEKILTEYDKAAIKFFNALNRNRHKNDGNSLPSKRDG